MQECATFAKILCRCKDMCENVQHMYIFCDKFVKTIKNYNKNRIYLKYVENARNVREMLENIKKHDKYMKKQKK